MRAPRGACGSRSGAAAASRRRVRCSTRSRSRALFFIFAPAAARIFSTNVGCKFINAQRNRAFGLQHEVDGAETQGFERRLGPFRRQRRHHDHGARPLDHDAIETFEAAHLRHVNVERDDGRAGTPRAVAALRGRCARTRTSKSGSLAEHAAEQLADERGVIDDENLDHAFARLAFWKASRRPRSAAVRSSDGIEHEHDALRLLEVDHAANEPRDLVGERGRRLDGARRHAQHVRHAVDDQPRAVALGPDHDEAPALGLARRRHVEAAALVDDGQHVAAQVHDALEEFRRLRQARDLRRHFADFVDGFDRQPELVLAQAEHQKLSALACGESAGVAGVLSFCAS